jgi:hypothetical protein
MPFHDPEKARAAAMKALEARRAKREQQQKAMAQGVGESKPFIQEGERDPYEGLRGLHIGGRPVEEVVPVDKVHLFSYWHTDEGIAERNAGKAESAARVTEGQFDKTVRQRAEVWSAPDVLVETAQPFIEKGFCGRFLSERVIQRSGKRGWEVVTHNGEPVRLGNLILGRMPKEEADRRNEYFRAQGEIEAKHRAEEFQEQAERLNREAKGAMSISVPGPGTVLNDARNPGRRVTVGVTSHRGNFKNEE